jgi:uncharacterized protein (TIGR02118 family)
MIKLMMFAYVKDGMTSEQFQDYYERVHAPLAYSLLPMMHEYRRNFIDRRAEPVKIGARPPEFDVVTEMVFANEQDYQEFKRRIADPDVAGRLSADERNFMKSELMRSHLVIERRSESVSRSAQ